MILCPLVLKITERGLFGPLVTAVDFRVLTALCGRAVAPFWARVSTGACPPGALALSLHKATFECPFLLALTCAFWGQFQSAFLIMGPIFLCLIIFSGHQTLQSFPCSVMNILYSSTHYRALFGSAVKFLIPSGLAFRVC